MKKGVAIGLGVLAVVVVAALYAYIERPARAVGSAVQKLSEAETQHFEATITLDNPAATQSLLQGAGTLTVELSGSFDRRGPQRDSFVTDVTINTQTEGVTLELAGELRFIEDKAYLLVKKSPAAIPLLVRLRDQWVVFPRGQVAEEAASPEDTPLFNDMKRVGREKVGERSAVKYEVTATQRAIVGFMSHVAQLLGTELTDDQVSTIRRNLSQVEELPVTLWITPLSHELVQLETQLGESGTRYTIKFGERNELVSHAAPEGAKPVNEVLQQSPPPPVSE